MPVYSYKCPKCEHTTESIKQVKQRDDDTPICPTCKLRTRRQLGAPRFRFKGVPTAGGGPDKFTADMLGLPLKELPAGLRADFKEPKP